MPPKWHFPVRECYGTVLLKQGDAPSAEEQFRNDLAQYPNNGWALLGLAQSMEQQPERYTNDKVSSAYEEYETAWSRSEIKLPNPCPMFFE
eukprot:scaffold1959_cov243-Pinguiococcus_pyrenoidosus.AAC.10